jgi:hypothetical protein
MNKSISVRTETFRKKIQFVYKQIENPKYPHKNGNSVVLVKCLKCHLGQKNTAENITSNLNKINKTGTVSKGKRRLQDLTVSEKKTSCPACIENYKLDHDDYFNNLFYLSDKKAKTEDIDKHIKENPLNKMKIATILNDKEYIKQLKDEERRAKNREKNGPRKTPMDVILMAEKQDIYILNLLHHPYETDESPIVVRCKMCKFLMFYKRAREFKDKLKLCKKENSKFCDICNKEYKKQFENNKSRYINMPIEYISECLSMKDYISDENNLFTIDEIKEFKKEISNEPWDIKGGYLTKDDVRDTNGCIPREKEIENQKMKEMREEKKEKEIEEKCGEFKGFPRKFNKGRDLDFLEFIKYFGNLCEENYVQFVSSKTYIENDKERLYYIDNRERAIEYVFLCKKEECVAKFPNKTDRLFACTYEELENNEYNHCDYEIKEKSIGTQNKNIDKLLHEYKGSRCLTMRSKIKTEEDEAIFLCEVCRKCWLQDINRAVNLNMWCINCAKNNKHQSETMVRMIFEGIFSDHEFDSTMISCVSSKGKCLQLDGYNKELGAAFEANGIQHYELCYLNNFDRKILDAQIERDKLKKEWCEKNGIVLIVVKYTITDKGKDETIKYICEELTEKLKTPIVMKKDLFKCEINYVKFFSERHFGKKLVRFLQNKDNFELVDKNAKISSYYQEFEVICNKGHAPFKYKISFDRINMKKDGPNRRYCVKCHPSFTSESNYVKEVEKFLKNEYKHVIKLDESVKKIRKVKEMFPVICFNECHEKPHIYKVNMDGIGCTMKGTTSIGRVRNKCIECKKYKLSKQSKK